MQSFQLCLTVNNYHTLLFFTLPIPLSLCLRVDLQGNYGKLCCNFAFCYWFSFFIKSKGFSHENTCPTFSLSSWNFELVYIFQIQLFYIFGLVNTLRQICWFWNKVAKCSRYSSYSNVISVAFDIYLSCETNVARKLDFVGFDTMW